MHSKLDFAMGTLVYLIKNLVLLQRIFSWEALLTQYFLVPDACSQIRLKVKLDLTF